MNDFDTFRALESRLLVDAIGKGYQTHMQTLRRKPSTWPSLHLILGACGAIFASAMTCMAAEDSTGTVVANARGIEHVLYLAVRSDPASQLLTQAGGEAVTAKLGVKLRISAHSQEANFFGIVPATVSEFDLGKGSPDQEVWRDGKCHHERGFPKISVTAVDGSIKNGRRQIPVDARWRQLGLFVPQDEVQASKRMDNGTDKVGYYLATRTETKQSRLFVDLKLYILPCDLTVSARRNP